LASVGRLLATAAQSWHRTAELVGAHRPQVRARNEHLGLLATAVQSWSQTAELVGGHRPQVRARNEHL